MWKEDEKVARELQSDHLVREDDRAEGDAHENGRSRDRDRGRGRDHDHGNEGESVRARYGDHVGDCGRAHAHGRDRDCAQDHDHANGNASVNESRTRGRVSAVEEGQ